MLRSTRRPNAKDTQEDQGLPHVDPWVTIDRTVRGIDEEQVHDCKEDMDTLLVFAGLFSAVLTSFLVQSYQNLTENPQETTNDLLRQISSQTSSYKFQNGFLNSTASPSPSSSSSAFQATPTDVRVNICWFASLILSLSTASFGMLVKQWLREYLAIGRTVPQERIRIRHFRHHGLEEWKLFEIAAALPLVLQLSLALFFVGLCYFTSEIHPSIRTASLTLVSGWASLFGFTFLAPLVSARCPYKTTFLKAAFRRARPRLRDILINPALGFVQQLSSRLHAGMKQLCTNISKLCDKVARSMGTQDNERHGPMGIDLPQHEDVVVGHLGDSTGNSDHSSRDLPDGVMEALKHYTLDAYGTMLEEDEARISEGNDLHIFREVDDVLRDDNLLAAVRGALQRKRFAPDDALCFVVSTLHGHLGLQASHLPDSVEILQITSELAPSTCLAFLNILSDVLQRGDPSWCVGFIIPLMLLLGREGRSYLEGMTPVFQHVLSKEELRFWVLNTIRDRTMDAWQVHFFSTLADAFKTLDPSILRSVVHRTYVHADEEPTFESKTYSRLLDCVTPPRADNTEWQRRVPPQVLETLLGLVISILQGMADGVTDSQALDAPNIAHFKELLQFLFDAIPVRDQPPFLSVPFYDSIADLIQSVFSTPALISILFECLGAHRGFFSADAWYWALQHPAWFASESLSADDRSNVLAAITTFFQTKSHSQAPLTAYQTLVYAGCVPFDPSFSDEHRTQLKRIFSFIIESLNKASRPPRLSLPVSPSIDSESPTPKLLDEESSISALANAILFWIDRHPHSEDGLPSGSAVQSNWQYDGSNSDEVEKENAKYYQWRSLFDVGESIYPDELIALLRNLCIGNTRDFRGRMFWRVRRLEDMERGDYGYGLGAAQDATLSAHGSMSLEFADHDAEAVSDPREPQILSSGGRGTDYGEMMGQQAHGFEEPVAREGFVVGTEDLHTPAANVPKPLGATSGSKAESVEPDQTSDAQFGHTNVLTDLPGPVSASSSRECASPAASTNAGSTDVDEPPDTSVVVSVSPISSAAHSSPDTAST
ncbi:hypothetical protein NM688_g5717 [Phlebia brevispora]|uniref:Uncharacterized protein n=1 Tax=Phlebia brevispora TaxID=194682 RepID=A0ACC1SR10_9APHY|nr:hypothetical protein NM688_g5717 [Phlebia brevispora]